jgi:hypothetical protein
MAAALLAFVLFVPVMIMNPGESQLRLLPGFFIQLGHPPRSHLA